MEAWLVAGLGVDEQVPLVRRFNRFYTRQIGVLNESWLDSRLSLTAVRVLYELAHDEGDPAGGLTPKDLVERIGIDAGYLSRIVQRFTKQGYAKKAQSPADARVTHLSLTAKGRRVFETLDAKAAGDVAGMLGKLSLTDRGRLTAAMETIEELLGDRVEPRMPYILRPPGPGDMGWVVHRHGVLYAEEYGWDDRFEALVAEVVTKFMQNFDPRRDRCWIAERDGEIVGSVFVAQGSNDVAKLRLLLVEPSTRGLGIGSRLVDECATFARQAGYKTLSLWTSNVLTAARRIYERAGFELVHQEPHELFGKGLVGETWEKKL